MEDHGSQRAAPNSVTLEFFKFCNNRSANLFQAPYSSEINTMFEALNSGLKSYLWNLLLPKPDNLQLDNCQGRFQTFLRYSYEKAVEGKLQNPGISYKNRMTAIFGEHAFNNSVYQDHVGCLAVLPVLHLHLQNYSDTIRQAMELTVNLSKTSTVEDGLTVALNIMDHFETLHAAVQIVYRSHTVCSWIDRCNFNAFKSFHFKQFDNIRELRSKALATTKQLPVVYEHLVESINSYQDLSMNFQKYIVGGITKFNLSSILMESLLKMLMNDIHSDNQEFNGKITSSIHLLQTAKKLAVEFYNKLFNFPVPIINASNAHIFDLIKAENI